MNNNDSAVSICNRALGYLGSGGYIESMDSDSTLAQYCRMYFDNTRRIMLGSHNWRFARTSKALAQADKVELKTPYRYYYSFPGDCIRLMGVKSAPGLEGLDARERPYKVYIDGNSRIIATNCEYAIGYYVADVTDPSVYPPLFAEAFAVRLAAEMCLSVTGGNMQTRIQLLQIAQDALSEAITADAQESEEYPLVFTGGTLTSEYSLSGIDARDLDDLTRPEQTW